VITVAAVSSNWIWYFGRATGFVALILMTAIIVLGILGRLRFGSERWPRFALSTLHRDLALMALLVLGIHIATSILDTYVSIPVTAAFVPFVSDYQPFWVGLGALAVDVMVAVIITSLLRRRIGLRMWKAIHWLNYAVWPMAVAHGIGIGTDAGGGWGLWLTIACCVIVGVAVLTRIISGAGPNTPPVPGPSAPSISARRPSAPASLLTHEHPGSAGRVRTNQQVSPTPGRVRSAEWLG